MQNIFITGGSGYIGSRLIKALNMQGKFLVKALARKGSEHKVPTGCTIVQGNALDAGTYQKLIDPNSIFVHLIGVAHPSPSKKELFKKIDLVSVEQAVVAAKQARAKHFVYVSVSQFPSGIMKEYQKARAEGEQLILNIGIPCSFVRPWYVLGPGHWWPLILTPAYFVAKLFPSTRERAERHGLVTINQMINALVWVIENCDNGNRTLEVADIKKFRNQKLSSQPSSLSVK